MPLENHKDQIRRLFEEYYIGLVEFVKRITGCEESSRDIVQNIFVKLLDKDSGLPREEFKIKSYLFSMAKNAAINHIRHQRVVNNFLRNNSQIKIADDNILEALIYSESIYELHKAIKNLPHACQEVCTLSYFEEKSNSEIAEYNRKSINTIKTHKRRTIELLREQLLPHK